MIVAALAALFLGVGGSGLSMDDLKDRVKQAISDQATVEQVDGVLTEMDNLMTAYEKELKSTGQQISEANKDYDAPDSKFKGIIADGIETGDASRGRLLDLRFQMKDLMTEEEWAAVFAPKDETKKDDKNK